ncbi:hypothetical protein MTX78_25180 (plasmid) [Hymenobacter tibetensis]|uniref:Uncharacterized protein n=1 Tax=Hymenobacter tibetensis TaxID=497967 RepID=A0ABY4D926_9BACT|nr:hypothetical protein [Hymenobacter tibetensis]UOG77669.1 hypothetical protein MTX78_25180 [Hymenobacter tibetensis]
MTTPVSPVVPFFIPMPTQADFLAAHQIIFIQQTEDYCLFIERNATARVRAYVFVPYDGFYLAEQQHWSNQEVEQYLPVLQHRVTQRWLNRNGRHGWRPVLRREPGLEDNPMSDFWLPQLAGQAAQAPWAPEGTIECFEEIVQLAFIGYCDAYEGRYTAQGLQLWPQENSPESFRTLQQHLHWLQEGHFLMAYSTSDEQRVTVQFQQEVLAPAMDLIVLPAFFRTLFFE